MGKSDGLDGCGMRWEEGEFRDWVWTRKKRDEMVINGGAVG